MNRVLALGAAGLLGGVACSNVIVIGSQGDSAGTGGSTSRASGVGAGGEPLGSTSGLGGSIGAFANASSSAASGGASTTSASSGGTCAESCGAPSDCGLANVPDGQSIAVDATSVYWGGPSGLYSIAKQ